jgi:hypothetical protein
MKEFIVKENAGFRLRVKMWKCSTPSDMNSIEFIQESKSVDGNVDMASTYQFFMTDNEIQNLCKGLLQ